MTSAVLFGSFILLLILSVPIGIALALSSLFALLYSGTLPLEFLAQSFITSVDSFPIMAVPFFILAGELMGRGGVSKRLFNVAESLVGNLTGGIAMATVLTSMFFASISGSGPATVAAIGGMLIPQMVAYGYSKKFATALVAAAGSLGVILPPSIPMIMYGVSGGGSVGDLFIAGIIPGALIGLILTLYSYFHSKKMGYTGNGKAFSMKELLSSVWDAKWALLVPIIILGGIYGGVFTPTEAAAVAVMYAFVAGLLIYKEFKIIDVPKMLVNSSLTTATILLIIGTATAFGQLMTIEHIPATIANGLLSITENPVLIILLIIMLLLVVGLFMDTTAAIIILTPLLLPVITQLGYDPIHFGIVMITTLAIGFITPPVGVNLFVASGISGLPLLTVAKAIIPFIILLLVFVIVLIFIPQLSLLLLG